AGEADRLATLDDDSDYQYDDHGNVLGGLRTPYVDTPAARLSGELNDGGAGCRLSGTTTLFDAATMASLYVDKAGYVSAVSEATDQAVERGFLLPPDAERIKAAAELQWDALNL
ncbi:MAG: alpha/beta hydrolase domain-containing protein, partial [Halieaceae bacterium]